MYKFKKELLEKIKMFNRSEITRITGVSYPIVINVLNNGESCSKSIAYAMTKFFDSEAEIVDYFERV